MATSVEMVRGFCLNCGARVNEKCWERCVGREMGYHMTLDTPASIFVKDVTVDGKLISHCVEFDVREGSAVVYDMSKPWPDEMDELPRNKIYGKVDFTVIHD